MAIYRNSEMTMYYPEELASETWPCDVRIDSGTIVVSYRSDDGPVVYRGTEIEPGHFKLTATEVVTGRATLHRFGDDESFDGRWYENGQVGMWQIDLAELA
ncbi:hypothetical protein [Rhizobium laguerreae]|uniref:hypothetical protein n=1 Tax=Rhizobium laguerreae TaxID=1076926 RepID=UPI001C90CDED|nr:hypothetical protein [Rhizobium laguerreae]MBY3222789.1 hypothetical protein [Rhizobium laguerreae]